MANSQFSENLKYLRKIYCISQEEMAAKLGVKRSSYAYFESNSRLVREIEQLRNVIFDTFGFTLDDLLTADLKENPTPHFSKRELLLSSIDSRLEVISNDLKLLK